MARAQRGVEDHGLLLPDGHRSVASRKEITNALRVPRGLEGTRLYSTVISMGCDLRATLRCYG
jgi:hypothetical protein